MLKNLCLCNHLYHTNNKKNIKIKTIKQKQPILSTLSLDSHVTHSFKKNQRNEDKLVCYYWFITPSCSFLLLLFYLRCLFLYFKAIFNMIWFPLCLYASIALNISLKTRERQVRWQRKTMGSILYRGGWWYL